MSPDTLLKTALDARRRGDFPAAVAAARRLSEMAPERLDGWFLWGTSAMSAGTYAQAEQVLAEGARRAPPAQRLRFLSQRARALVTLGRSSEAVNVVDEALKFGTDDAAELNRLGTTLSQAGLPDRAIPLLQRALANDPNASDYWYNLGGIQQFLGALDATETAYERAIACGPNAAAHLALARLKKWTPNTNHIARLSAAPRRSLHDTARLGYALFKELDDLNDTQSAWTALTEGAHAARQMGGYDAAQETEIVEKWISYFPAASFQAQPKNPTPSAPRRIFIIGLPRSGTTLIERILTAHSAVQALGELQTFGLAAKHLSGSRTPHLLDPDTITRLASVNPADIAARYDAETAYLHDGHSRYTIDKLPHNHDYAGLIRLAWPDAILIHVRRDPKDSLFGAYKLLFAHAHKWSYDLDDLATHYDHYRRLMAHWKSVLGEGLIDISLEAVIADPEPEIRKLIAACGLDFEPACLSPHTASGAVATASSAQVRRPINAEGVGAWKRYAAQLEPLRQNLSALGYI